MSERIKSFGGWWPEVDADAPVDGDRTIAYDIGDDNQLNAGAIKPVSNAESADQSVLRRPTENLRARTESLRFWTEELSYLLDSDRALFFDGAGTITWNGTGTGTFALAGGDLHIRPMLAPTASTQAFLHFGTPSDNEVVLTGNVGSPKPREYSGANKITVEVTGINGGTLRATVDGAPANFIHVVVKTGAGFTTAQQLIDYLNSNSDAGTAAILALGLHATLGAGSAGTHQAPTTNPTRLRGAVDAELHTITAAGLAAFFGASTDNLLVEGDVLAVQYAATSGTGGRRESIPDAPESSDNVDGNLFVMRRFPERVPNALPVACVTGGILILGDGHCYLTGVTRPVRGGVSGISVYGLGVNNSTPGVEGLGVGNGVGVKGTGGATSGIGVSGQGTGLGSGVAGIAGDTTNAIGVYGAGGASNGVGVGGQGTGTAPGGAFSGGITDGAGVKGTGGGAGNGVTGTGGTTSGTGVDGTGGSPNGYGVKGHGTGTGPGGAFTSPTGVGAVATGGGASEGVVGTGGATSGIGVRGVGGAPNGVGVQADGTGTGVALIANDTFMIMPRASAPTGVNGLFWVDDSASPSLLKFYDGVGWKTVTAI